MSTALPREGVGAYMERQALSVQAGNFWWRVHQQVGPGWFVSGLFVAMGALTALFWGFPSLISASATASLFMDALLRAAIISGAMFGATALLVSSNIVPPAEWTRHSLARFNARYGGRLYISGEVQRVRAYNAEAEFEVAVLERQGNGPHGFVLFQVMKSTKDKPLENAGTPLLILSGTGSKLEFEETYMPALSF